MGELLARPDAHELEARPIEPVLDEVQRLRQVEGRLQEIEPAHGAGLRRGVCLDAREGIRHQVAALRAREVPQRVEHLLVRQVDEAVPAGDK